MILFHNPRKTPYSPECISQEIKSSETKIVISNEAKKPIIVESIDVAGCSKLFSAEMKIGETSDFTLTGCNNGKKGKTIKGEILLTYTEKKTGLQRDVHGKIKSSASSICTPSPFGRSPASSPPVPARSRRR
jgi:hypothetical protein